MTHSSHNSDTTDPLPRSLISHPYQVMVACIILVISVAFFNVHAAPKIQPHAHAHNSQTMSLLQPQFSVEPQLAIGGSEDIVTIDNALQSQLGLLKDPSSREYVNKTGISYYIVRNGDTLSEIAETFDVSVKTIEWENKLTGSIKPGQELVILPVSGVRHTVVKGDNFGNIAKKYDAEIEDIIVYNDLIVDTEIKVGTSIIVPNGTIAQPKPQPKTTTKKTSTSSNRSSGSKAQSGYYIKPAAGTVTSRMGPRNGRYHYGTDIGAPTGTPIVAAASGVIKKIGCGRGYGKCVVITHNNGTETLYAHASAIYVSTGQTVQQGQKIAAVGSTGNSTGPHLHFEITSTSTGKRLRPTSF